MFSLKNEDRNFTEKDIKPGQYINRIGDLVEVVEPYTHYEGRGWLCFVQKAINPISWNGLEYKVNVKGFYDDYAEDGLDLIVKTQNGFMGIFESGKTFRTRDGRKATALHKLVTEEDDSVWVVAVRNPDGREIAAIYVYTGQFKETIGGDSGFRRTMESVHDIVDVWSEPPRVRTAYILDSFLDEMKDWPIKAGFLSRMICDKPQPTNKQEHGSNHYVKIQITEIPE